MELLIYISSEEV